MSTLKETPVAEATHANQYGYSDVYPFEIVRKVSDKTIVIRAMNYTRDDSVKLEFNVGGFSAHCVNQSEQKWICESDTDRPEIRVRLHKDGWWRDSNGNKYGLSMNPRRFYDYNF